MPITKIAPKSLASMTPSDLITHTVEGSPVSQKWLLCTKKNCNSILEKNYMLFVNYFIKHCIIFL